MTFNIFILILFCVGLGTGWGYLICYLHSKNRIQEILFKSQAYDSIAPHGKAKFIVLNEGPLHLRSLSYAHIIQKNNFYEFLGLVAANFAPQSILKGFEISLKFQDRKTQCYKTETITFTKI